MRFRYITTALLLLAAIVQASAQALTQRYNRQRPVIIVSSRDYIDITKAIMKRLDLPFKFVEQDSAATPALLDRDIADLILADGQTVSPQAYSVSRNIINYRRISADSIAEICYVSNDHQLIDQIDDQFMRLRLSGEIARIQDRWIQKAQSPSNLPSAQQVNIAVLLLTAVLIAALILTQWHRRRAVRHAAELEVIIRQAQRMGHYYDSEDSQAVHDQTNGYEAILCNPFVAIAFYDNKGRLIVQNEAMKKLGDNSIASSKQPLYDAKGELINYFVATSLPAAT